jgi:hypothetical protein
LNENLPILNPKESVKQLELGAVSSKDDPEQLKEQKSSSALVV